MEFAAQKEQIMEPLQALMGVVERKQTFPILANVLLTVEGARFSLVGTDLEIELITEGSLSKTQTGGTLTVPAKKWFDVLRTLPDGEVVHYFLEDNDKLRIRSESGRFLLNTLPAQDFPRMERLTDNQLFEIPEKLFLELLKKTAFSMAEQDVRHYLNGLFLDLSPKKLKAVASDGHRLALSEVPLPSKEVEKQVILPRKAVLELMRLLQVKDQPGIVQIGQIFQLKAQTFTFSCKLIDAKFPPYQSLIPKTCHKTVLLEREPFKQSLQRVAALSNEKDQAVRFKLTENCVTMRSSNPVHEEAEVMTPATYTGEDFEIAFNGYYLLDVLNVMQAKQVEMWLSLPEQGIRVQEENNLDTLYIIMPTFL